MLTIKDIKKILEENNIFMGFVRGIKAEKIIMIRCVFCGDSSKNKKKCHFQIIQKKWKGRNIIAWRCARCDESGTISKLFDILGIQFDRKKYEAQESLELLRDFKRPDIHGIRTTFNIEKREVKTIDRLSLIRKVKTKESTNITKQLIRYLSIKRKYTKSFLTPLLQNRQIILADNIFIKGNPKLAPLFNRILFPSYNNIIVQGRLIDEFGKRYYIYRENENEDISDIIVFDNIGSVVFLVEGPFDALRINSYGFPVISLQGKNIGNLVSSYNTFEKTRKFFSRFTKIIFCFDNEVEYDSLKKYCLELFKSGIMNNKQEVGYLMLYETNYKDIDEVYTEAKFEFILNNHMSFFSSLDHVSNYFKDFLKNID